MSFVLRNDASGYVLAPELWSGVGISITPDITITVIPESTFILDSSNVINGNITVNVVPGSSFSIQQSSGDFSFNGDIQVSVIPASTMVYVAPATPCLVASSIVSSLRSQLKDPNGVRWPDALLLSYIEAGQRLLCSLKSSAYTGSDTMLLAPGTRQEVGCDFHKFVRALRNMGADGVTPGGAISFSNISDLDRFNPNWHTDPASAVVTDFAIEYQTPTIFWVYPPVSSSASVFIEFEGAKVPPAVTSLTTNLVVSTIYSAALYEYGMYRALSLDDENAQDFIANQHRERFYNAIGLKVVADSQIQQQSAGAA